MNGEFTSTPAHGSNPDDQAIAALALRVKAQRLHRNWPQSEFAVRAGISRASYQNFENGVGTLNLRHLVKVLALLGCRDAFAEIVPMPTLEPIKVVLPPTRLRAYPKRKHRRCF